MFWKFVATLQLSKFWKYCKFLLGGVFVVPSNSAIFGDTANFCLVGYLLSPPTWQFLEIFGSFVLRVIFCALRFSNFWQFLEVFVSRVIICAPRFCGVSCVLEEFPLFWIIDCREDCWAYRLVVCCGVMLCEVICQVLCARSPVIMELSLGIAAP